MPTKQRRAKRPHGIEMSPVQVTETAWYYEYPLRLCLVVECRDRGERVHTQEVYLPASKLAASLRHMGFRVSRARVT